MADKKGQGNDDDREFASILVDLADANTAAGESLRRVIAGVKETGKAGALTIKVAVTRLPDSDNALIFTPTVTENVPKKGIRAQVFYADDRNNPQRNDPNNPGLFDEGDVRSTGVDPNTGEVKDVPAEGVRE